MHARTMPGGYARFLFEDNAPLVHKNILPSMFAAEPPLTVVRGWYPVLAYPVDWERLRFRTFGITDGRVYRRR